MAKSPIKPFDIDICLEIERNQGQELDNEVESMRFRWDFYHGFSMHDRLTTRGLSYVRDCLYREREV